MPAKTLADFRQLPNLTKETKDDLRGTEDAPTAPDSGSISYRLTYADGLDVRVMDYGTSAFVTRLRVSGADHAIKDEVKIGAPRAQIEAVLGKPSRGGGGYSIYEGKTDVVRVFYTPTGTIGAVEIDRGM